MDDRQWREMAEQRGCFRAELRVTPTAEGGRQTYLLSGYRASWDFGQVSADGLHVVHDAPLIIEDRDRLYPGESGSIRLVPLIPEHWQTVTPGVTLQMREGARVVGDATITALVPGA